MGCVEQGDSTKGLIPFLLSNLSFFLVDLALFKIECGIVSLGSWGFRHSVGSARANISPRHLATFSLCAISLITFFYFTIKRINKGLKPLRTICFLVQNSCFFPKSSCRLNGFYTIQVGFSNKFGNYSAVKELIVYI